MDEGALCLSSWGWERLDSRNPDHSSCQQDKHEAPTLLRVHPLSLQDAGDASVPMGVMTLFDWQNSSGRRQTFPIILRFGGQKSSG